MGNSQTIKFLFSSLRRFDARLKTVEGLVSRSCSSSPSPSSQEHEAEAASLEPQRAACQDAVAVCPGGTPAPFCGSRPERTGTATAESEMSEAPASSEPEPDSVSSSSSS